VGVEGDVATIPPTVRRGHRLTRRNQPRTDLGAAWKRPSRLLEHPFVEPPLKSVTT
jgi:hypothetical protein